MDSLSKQLQSKTADMTVAMDSIDGILTVLQTICSYANAFFKKIYMWIDKFNFTAKGWNNLKQQFA